MQFFLYFIEGWNGGPSSGDFIITRQHNEMLVLCEINEMVVRLNNFFSFSMRTKYTQFFFFYFIEDWKDAASSGDLIIAGQHNEIKASRHKNNEETKAKQRKPWRHKHEARPEQTAMQNDDRMSVWNRHEVYWRRVYRAKTSSSYFLSNRIYKRFDTRGNALL